MSRKTPPKREKYNEHHQDLRARDLVATGGSDWHGPGTAPDLGVEIPDDDAARLLTWLGR